MIINFNNFSTLNKPPSGVIAPKALPYPYSIVQGSLSYDTFEKTQETQRTKEAQSTAQTKQTTNIWGKERLEAIYNEVYAEVVAQNPIIKELNIQKPVFVFKEIKNKPGEEINFAAYSFLNNSIELTSNFCEPLYAVGIKDENGDLAELIDINIKSVLDEEFEQSKKLEPNLIAIELTDSEKEFRIRGSIAHELRHWIQEHTMASNRNTMAKHKEFYQKTGSQINKILEGVDRAQLSQEDRLATDTTYALNYKPKKVLKDKYFKLSRLPSDKRYWSMKNHMLKSTTDEDYNNNYFASPVEADANYFAFEYLASKMPKTYSNQTRKEIITSIIICCEQKANEAILDMEKCGYPPIKRKLF